MGNPGATRTGAPTRSTYSTFQQIPAKGYKRKENCCQVALSLVDLAKNDVIVTPNASLSFDPVTLGALKRAREGRRVF